MSSRLAVNVSARLVLFSAFSQSVPSYRDKHRAQSQARDSKIKKNVVETKMVTHHVGEVKGNLPLHREQYGTMKVLDQDLARARKTVAYRAVDDFVVDGMKVGMGTGTTTWHAIERLGEKIRKNELINVTVIPASVSAKKHCIQVGIPVSPMAFADGELDLTIDGADEVDITMALMKGGSGSFLREKILENCSRQVVIVADEDKLVRTLGPGHPLPVEIVSWDHEHTIKRIESLPALKGNARGILRRGSAETCVADGNYPATTDNGNFILDLFLSRPIMDLGQASFELNGTSGVVEHGLFSGQATTILIATRNTQQYPLGRVIGHYPKAPGVAEQPWWGDKPDEWPLQRITVDNRDPEYVPVEKEKRAV